MRTGQQLVARILFVSSSGDLDLDVYGPDGTTLLGQSHSSTDDESVTITATQDGRHYARVFGVGGAVNDYVLSATVTGP